MRKRCRLTGTWDREECSEGKRTVREGQCPDLLSTVAGLGEGQPPPRFCSMGSELIPSSPRTVTSRVPELDSLLGQRIARPRLHVSGLHWKSQHQQHIWTSLTWLNKKAGNQNSRTRERGGIHPGIFSLGNGATGERGQQRARTCA